MFPCSPKPLGDPQKSWVWRKYLTACAARWPLGEINSPQIRDDDLPNFITWGTGANPDIYGQRENSRELKRRRRRRRGRRTEEPKNVRDAYLDVIGKSKVKWKREVICCAHWSSGQHLSLDDLPDVKHTFKDDTLAINWHWNCAAALCTNSWRTPGIHYYKLCEIARDKELKCAYEKVVKNKNVDWKRNVICSEHWSKGKRLSIQDIPDRSTSSSYIRKKTPAQNRVGSTLP